MYYKIINVKFKINFTCSRRGGIFGCKGGTAETEVVDVFNGGMTNSPSSNNDSVSWSNQCFSLVADDVWFADCWSEFVIEVVEVLFISTLAPLFRPLKIKKNGLLFVN